jgi:hypothetical protein
MTPKEQKSVDAKFVDISKGSQNICQIFDSAFYKNCTSTFVV